MSLTSYRAAPPRVIGGRRTDGGGQIDLSSSVVRRLQRPGGDLLFRHLSGSTIGAEGFHDRVRDGIGWNTPRRGRKVFGCREFRQAFTRAREDRTTISSETMMDIAKEGADDRDEKTDSAEIMSLTVEAMQSQICQLDPRRLGREGLAQRFGSRRALPTRRSRSAGLWLTA